MLWPILCLTQIINCSPQAKLNLPTCTNSCFCETLIRGMVTASKISQSRNPCALQNVNFHRDVCSLPQWEAAIGNKRKSALQLLLIADGLLICLVIRKADSTTCLCEYLLKADTQINSQYFRVFCWFDSLKERRQYKCSNYDFRGIFFYSFISAAET